MEESLGFIWNKCMSWSAVTAEVKNHIILPAAIASVGGSSELDTIK